MEIWQVVLLILAVLVLFCVVIFFIVKSIIDRIFARVERPKFSAYLRMEEVEKEYPREQITFTSGENRLQAYIFGAENTKGLVVVVHGLGGGAENYLEEICYFVKRGFRVFAYDNTGYYLSEGKNSVGLPQTVEDLKAALGFIENENRFAGLPVYLFGHSWGGYSVCAVLNFVHNVKAVISVAGFSDPNKMIFEWGKRKVGKLAYLFAPFLYLHQRISFGKKLDITAVDGINTLGVPVLLIHGDKDDTVRIDGAATISCKNQITNPKAQYLLWEKEGQNGHMDILFDTEARKYSLQINEQFAKLMKMTKNQLTAEDKAEFISNVDKIRTSVPNEELMNLMVAFYEGA